MAIDTLYIPVGNVLVATSDGSALGSYSRLAEPGIVNYAPVAISASTVYTIGPFNEPRTYKFEYSGAVTYTNTFSGSYTADDAAGLVAIPADPGELDTLANDADGTAIAAEVNSINAILIAAGLAVAAE